MPSQVLARATNSSDASRTQAAASAGLSGNFSEHVVTTSTALSGRSEYRCCPSLMMKASINEASFLYEAGRFCSFSFLTPSHQLRSRKLYPPAQPRGLQPGGRKRGTYDGPYPGSTAGAPSCRHPPGRLASSRRTSPRTPCRKMCGRAASRCRRSFCQNGLPSRTAKSADQR